MIFLNDEQIKEIISKLQEIDKSIIGIFPHMMVPLELIYAADCHPLILCLGGDDDMSTIGTEYLTQATCPFARGTLGFFENAHPLYKDIKYIVGGNYCNGDLTTTEMIHIYFNRKQIPITFPTSASPTSLKFFREELKNFKKRLEQELNVEISNDKIIESIQKYNKMRQLFREIDNIRISKGVIDYLDLQNLIYKAIILGPDYIIPELERIKNKQEKFDKKSFNGKKIVLTGSLIALGDRFLELISELDVNVVVNDTEFGRCFYERDIILNGTDLYDSFVNYYLKNTRAARMYPDNVSIPRAINFYKEYKANGVINHVLKFCDPFLAKKAIFKNELVENGVPVLEVERDYSTNIGQLKTRIEAFLEMI